MFNGCWLTIHGRYLFLFAPHIFSGGPICVNWKWKGPLSVLCADFVGSDQFAHINLRLMLIWSISKHHYIIGIDFGRLASPGKKLFFHVWMAVCDFLVKFTGWLHFVLQSILQYQLTFHDAICAFVAQDQHCRASCKYVGTPHLKICFWWGMVRLYYSCKHRWSWHICIHYWTELETFKFDLYRLLVYWWLQNMVVT